MQQRDRGTPQGSAVSPVLANLFLHYAFDTWMARKFPVISFERYVDDAVVHCFTERQARFVLKALGERMAEVGLTLHPEKTRIVYCRRGSHEHTSFTFLGYTFRARGARDRDGRMFTSFLPAISKDALNKISAEVRSWRLHLRTGHTFMDLVREINPIVSRLGKLLRRLLSVGAVSPSGTHQCLPGALDPSEIQAAAGKEEGPGELARDRQAISSPARALAMGPFGPARLVTRTVRAR